MKLAALFLAFAFAFQGDIAVQKLPDEARQTLALIEKNGRFPYPRDGAVFGNREGHLPKRERGYYREYTVRTPARATAARAASSPGAAASTTTATTITAASGASSSHEQASRAPA